MGGYHIPCICGKVVQSATPTAKCGECGRELVVEGWGATTPEQERSLASEMKRFEVK